MVDTEAGEGEKGGGIVRTTGRGMEREEGRGEEREKEGQEEEEGRELDACGCRRCIEAFLGLGVA